jgi:hypothetical protein
MVKTFEDNKSRVNKVNAAFVQLHPVRKEVYLPSVDNLTEEEFCVFKEISGMAILVPIYVENII